MLNLKVKETGVDELARRLDPTVVTKAARMALNTAARDTRSYASKKIREKYNVKAGLVGKAIRITKASSKNLWSGSAKLKAVISASPTPLSMMLFNPKWYKGRMVIGAKSGQMMKRASGKSGVYVKILKGKTTILSHAFIAAGRRGGKGSGFGVQTLGASGHLGVFQRVGRTRLPIKHRNVISISSMMGNENIMPALELKGGQVFEKEYTRQIKRLLQTD